MSETAKTHPFDAEQFVGEDRPRVHHRQSGPGLDEDGGCPRCKRDACDGTCTAAPALHFQTANEIISEPAPISIIEGIAWPRRVTVLASESGTGKTFLGLSQAAAVADGAAWLGRLPVQQGSVAYVSFEGDALNLRLRALREVAGHALENVHLLRASDPISPRVGRDGVEQLSIGEAVLVEALESLRAEIVAQGRPPLRLLTIDTIRASLSGSEDSSEHVSAYLRAVRRIMVAVPDAGAILLHHSGWQDGEIKRKRERGSSAFRGNADATLYLELVEDDPANHQAYLALRTLKVRDEERPAPLHLIRRRVELLATHHGHDPLTSCLIEMDPRSQADKQAGMVAQAQAESHTVDLKVLRAMREYPAATSQRKLRTYVGLKTDVVLDSITRILQAGWAVEGKRGQPYQITERGHHHLGGQP